MQTNVCIEFGDDLTNLRLFRINIETQQRNADSIPKTREVNASPRNKKLPTKYAIIVVTIILTFIV